jgi:spore coat polysaccharide biosynthesis predicted glycosyltransferase SpsG
MANLILYRVDGGKVWGISLGHVKRSLMLASRLKPSANILFVMKNYPDGVKYVNDNGFKVITLVQDDDSDQSLIKICDKIKPNKLLIDLIHNPYTSLFSYCRQNRIQTVVFDILGKFKGSPDIIINDTIVHNFAEYAGISNETRLCIGPQYFIIGSNINPIEPKQTIEQVLLTMGGSDPAGLTVKILRAIAGHSFTFKLNVVLGPLFTENKKVYEVIGDRPHIRVHENPENFLELLNEQDVIISAGGRTLYECAFLGKPVIIVPSIEHELATARAYAEVTGSQFLPGWEDIRSGEQLLAILDYYAGSYSIRKSIYEASRKMVDGDGMERILELIGQDGQFS